MTKTLARLSLFAAVCLMVSYVEALLPAFVALPGVKLGLANAVVTWLLLSGRVRYGAAVNLCRILLAGILFSGLAALPFALAGALCSGLTVVLLSKTGRFSPVSLSAAGGFAHNAAQLAVCALWYGSPSVLRVAPFVLLAGIACGLAVGCLALLLQKRLGRLIV